MAKLNMINSEQLSVSPVSYKIHGVSLPLIEVPIMKPRHRLSDSDTLMRDALILLGPIALAFIGVLWFF